MSNSIHINLTSPSPFIQQPTEGDGYKIVANDLLQGVEALSALHSIHPRSCALLAAHALECALKAFLWHEKEEKNTSDKFGHHQLIDLWEMAHKNGLDIPQTPPDWCRILSVGHGPDYYFRYQKGKNKTVAHGGQTPELTSMSIDLRNIIKIVNHAITPQKTPTI